MSTLLHIDSSPLYGSLSLPRADRGVPVTQWKAFAPGWKSHVPRP
jgi:hypothetical protein